MPRKKTILLVEDEALIALVQKESLQEYNYHVITAFTGEKAVEIVHDVPGIDLVLMDINLGKGMDGTQAAREILEEHDIPIVFLSSHTERDIVGRTENITSYGYVVKDSGITVLDASIKMAFKLHEAHRKVKESASQFKTITNTSIDIFLILDSDGGVIDVNEAGRTMTGYSRDELLGMSIRDLEKDAGEEAITHRLRKIIESGPERCETRHRLKDGRVIDVEAGITFLKERGQFLVFLHDITERKQAVQELVRLKEKAELAEREKSTLLDRLNEAQHIAGVGSWDWDILTGEVWWSDETYRIFDVTPEEFIPSFENNARFIHPGDARKYRQAFEHCLDTGEALNFDVRLLAQGGEVRDCNAQGRLVADKDGKPIRFVGTVMDISARKQMEAELIKSEAISKALLNLPQDNVILLIDKNGLLVDCNKSLSDRLGVGVDELRGKYIFDFLPPEVAQLRKAKFRESLKTGRSLHLEDESRGSWYESVYYPIFDEHGKIDKIAVFAYDITALKTTENALRRSEAKYRSIFENAVEGIFQTSPDGRYISVNPCLAGMFGYDSPGELIDAITDIAQQQHVHPEDRTTLRSLLDEQGFVEGFETHLYRKDGTRVWVSMNARTVRDTDGDVIYYEGTTQDITARKQAEEELKRSTMLLESVLNSTADLIVVLDKDLKVLMSNWKSPFFEGCTEFPASIHCYEAFIKRDTPCESCHALEVFRTGEPALVEMHNPTTGLFKEVNAYPLFDDDRRVTMVVEHVHDITAQKRAQEALRESEEQFRAMFQTVSIGMAQADIVTGRFLHANQKMCQITGYTPDELLAVSIPDITHPDDREKDRQAFQDVVAGRSPHYRLEKRYIRKDGRVVWVNVNMTVVRNAAGQPMRTLSAVEDITDRRKMAEKLFEEQERLRLIFNASPAGIILVDASGVIIHANEEMARMFGCTLDELIGSSYPSHVHPEERQTGDTKMRSLIAGEVDNVSTERYYVRKDGTGFWGYLSGRRQTDKNGNFLNLLGIILDVTDRKRTEDILISSLREKEVLLKEIHHRVKNNLQVMSSLLHLQSQHSDDARVLDIFRESANRVRTMALIHDRLYRSVNLSSINFREYVTDLARDLVGTYGTGKDVRLSVDVDPVAFDIDTAMPLGLLINELVSNALKHGFPDTTGGILRIGLHANCSHMTLSVFDNGVGFPEDLDFMDTPTLGMQLVVTLVEQLEGTIELRREKGTEFTIAFEA